MNLSIRDHIINNFKGDDYKELERAIDASIKENDEVNSLANKYFEELNKNNIISYIDNTNKSAGFKFAEAEVNGIPVRIEIGPRDLENGKVTIVRRDTREKIEIDVNSDIVSIVNDLMEEIQNNLYNRALERRNKQTYVAHNLEEMTNIMNEHPGFIKAMWCGSPECETKIKEIKGTKSRCIPFEQEHIDDKCVCCGKPAHEMVVWGIQY